MIFGSINRLRAAIADLSEVSRVQKEADEDVRMIDIADVVKDVQSDMALAIQEAGAKIENDLSSRPIRTYSCTILACAGYFRSL